jgi:uncharacterized protein
VTGVAVTNSTCLISLDRIGALDLLRRVFDEVLVPPAVVHEVGTPPKWLTIRAVANAVWEQALGYNLGPGESAAIGLAAEHPAAEIVLDDRKARRFAERIGLRIVGTPGIIIRAKRAGAVPAVLPILLDLRSHGFHMSDDIFTRCLILAGESIDAPST